MGGDRWQRERSRRRARHVSGRVTEFTQLTHSLFFSTLCGLNADVNTGIVDLTSGDLGVELELQTLLLEDLLGLLRDFAVHTGATDLAQEFNNGDLRAETRPDGSLCMVSIDEGLSNEDFLPSRVQ